MSAPSLTASCACDDATFVNCAALSASSSWSAVCAGSDWELCQKSCDANGFSPTGWSAAQTMSAPAAEAAAGYSMNNFTMTDARRTSGKSMDAVRV